MRCRTANTFDESRLDIKAKGFLEKGQIAFFDVRVTHVNSRSNKNLETSVILHNYETEKKRPYMERVIEIEHGIFTPLVFGTNGNVRGMR